MLNFLNNDMVNFSCPVSEFLDQNFFFILPTIISLMFILPNFFFLCDSNIILDYFLNNLEVFTFDNYSNIDQVKKSNLFIFLYYFISTTENLHKIYEMCDIEHKEEIKIFVSYMLNLNPDDFKEVYNLKNYKISYSALKDLSETIYLYVSESKI